MTSFKHGKLGRGGFKGSFLENIFITLRVFNNRDRDIEA